MVARWVSVTVIVAPSVLVDVSVRVVFTVAVAAT